MKKFIKFYMILLALLCINNAYAVELTVVNQTNHTIFVSGSSRIHATTNLPAYEELPAFNNVHYNGFICNADAVEQGNYVGPNDSKIVFNFSEQNTIASLQIGIYVLSESALTLLSLWILPGPNVELINKYGYFYGGLTYSADNGNLTLYISRNAEDVESYPTVITNPSFGTTPNC